MDNDIQKICDGSKFISVTHQTIAKLLMRNDYTKFESKMRRVDDIKSFCSKIVNNINNVSSQNCICNYAVCLNWYPCNYKNCKSLNNQETQSCSISSCRSCYHFRYASDSVMNCLWDI